MICDDAALLPACHATALPASLYAMIYAYIHICRAARYEHYATLQVIVMPPLSIKERHSDIILLRDIS